MGFLSTLGSIAGGIGGFLVGGPAGAIAGVKTGGSIGGALEGRRPNTIGNFYPQIAGVVSGSSTTAPIRAPSIATGRGLLGTVLPQSRAPALMPAPTSMPGGSIQIPVPDSVKVSGVNVAGLYQSGQATAYYSPQPGAPTGMQPCGVNGRMKATHLNKAGYFLRNGTYVAPATRCVPNRRQNPLNPRALSRSMRRVTSARRAIKAIIAFDRVQTPGGKIRVGKKPKR